MKTALLLKPKDFKPTLKSWTVKGVLNPGAIRTPDKKIILLVRVAEEGGNSHGKMMKCPIITDKPKKAITYQDIKKKDIVRVGEKKEIYLKDGVCRLPTISHFRKVIIDKDGFSVEKIEQSPAFSGKKDEGDFGVEDPRLVKIDEKYYITYVAISMYEGVSTYLASSSNLKDWKREGLIFREQNKDVVLFPEKIKGHYVALNRPESTMHFTKPGIWISYSKDLVYWGKDKNLMRPREKSWESVRIGSGPPPIKTKKGWLLIYHGMTEKKNAYSAGAVLLDLKNPEKILARTSAKEYLFGPNKKYEKKGFINNVVFPTGAVETLDKKNLLVYSGAADTQITVREISYKKIFNSLLKHD